MRIDENSAFLLKTRFVKNFEMSVKHNNMYKCYICKKIIDDDVKGLFSHLRSEHFLCELSGFSLKCGQGDCIRSYPSFNSLGKHLRSQHTTTSEFVSSQTDSNFFCIIVI